MKFQRLIICLALLGLAIPPGLTADVAISALPAAGALGGTEAVPAVQGGATKKTTPAAIDTYISGTTKTLTNKTLTAPVINSPTGLVKGDVGLGNVENTALSTWAGSSSITTLGTISTGTVPLSNLATQSNGTLVGNFSGSTATPTALHGGQVINIISSVIAASVVSTSNITLSGTQTIDGISVAIGQSVLVAGQTTGSQNGIYIVQSGAWTRAPYFPSGYVLPVQCEIVVAIKTGTTHVGQLYRLATTSAITIGTTSQSWAPSTIPNGSVSVAGTVLTTDSGNRVISSSSALASLPDSSQDCAYVNKISSTNYSIDSNFSTFGYVGTCVTMSIDTLHINTGDGTTLASTSTGSIGAGSNDNKGFITGLSVATSVTLTFAAPYTWRPSCVVSGSAAMTLVTVNPADAGGDNTWETVVFGMGAYTGTLYYICF